MNTVVPIAIIDGIDRYRADSGRTKKHVITTVLAWFLALDPDIQEMFFTKRGAGAAELSAELSRIMLERMATHRPSGWSTLNPDALEHIKGDRDLPQDHVPNSASPEGLSGPPAGPPAGPARPPGRPAARVRKRG